MATKRIERIVRNFPENGLKVLLENPGNVRDLLQLVAAALVPLIDFGRMRLDRSHFVQRDYHHLESDLVLQAPLLGRRGRRGVTIYILIEHQSEPDALMVFRVLEYVVAIFRRQLNRWQGRHGSRTGFHFQPVLPIVVYSGSRPWTSLGRLVDLVEQGDSFTAVTPALEPLFLNIQQMRAADLEGRGGYFGWLLRLLQQRGAPLPQFEALLRRAVQELEAMPAADRARWLEFLSYIHALVYYERGTAEHEALQERIQTSVRTGAHGQEVFDMARTMAEVLISKGKKEGREEGREEGRKEEAVRSRQQTLLRQLGARFGKIPAKLKTRIEATTRTEQLDVWLEQVVNANTLADIDILSQA